MNFFAITWANGVIKSRFKNKLYQIQNMIIVFRFVHI